MRKRTLKECFSGGVVPEAGIEPARLAAGDFRTYYGFRRLRKRSLGSGARLHHSTVVP